MGHTEVGLDSLNGYVYPTRNIEALVQRLIYIRKSGSSGTIKKTLLNAYTYFTIA